MHLRATPKRGQSELDFKLLLQEVRECFYGFTWEGWLCAGDEITRCVEIKPCDSAAVGKLDQLERVIRNVFRATHWSLDIDPE